MSDRYGRECRRVGRLRLVRRRVRDSGMVFYAWKCADCYWAGQYHETEQQAKKHRDVQHVCNQAFAGTEW